VIDLYKALENYTDDPCLELILQEHPEMQILWKRRDSLKKPMVINGTDPLLHVIFEAIIEKQIQDTDPPEVTQALERMVSTGFRRTVARGVIVRLFRWNFDQANQGNKATVEIDYLQKLNFLGQDPQKLERNQPCPCLSGKKFKKCCLSIKDLLEIDPTEGTLLLGTSSYFKPPIHAPEYNPMYTEMENRIHFTKFLEEAGDYEGAFLYLQENAEVTQNQSNPQILENALQDLFFFCSQHPEFTCAGIETADRLIQNRAFYPDSSGNDQAKLLTNQATDKESLAEAIKMLEDLRATQRSTKQ
jgi:hypothetical protein